MAVTVVAKASAARIVFVFMGNILCLRGLTRGGGLSCIIGFGIVIEPTLRVSRAAKGALATATIQLPRASGRAEPISTCRPLEFTWKE